MYSPTDDWKTPEPGDLFDEKASTTEQHRQEQRATLEWLQGSGQIKLKPKLKARGQSVPKRPRIVSTAETTLQEGLRPSGYTSPS